ncbi:helix-turn-helix domain-containing protein [Actinopolyspora mortivallis]|uniref:Transcriptional regulator n=1 Tax=Actinopolyspora mortivallis TaxID=33906 RepID=A0A2T0GRD8_ACTMO|nr:helix-turn-helix domain-containing protein [Actinopolyspora mortivallis]PRW61675.1 transcriptional regulator [Actinopolyspora mortivallis]
MSTPTTNQPRTLLTVEQAAQRLAIGRTRMFQLLRTGEVASVRIGRARRIPTDALESYIDRLTAEQRTA